VTSPEWHPDDERLLGRYLDRTAGDESLDRHLVNCAVCSTRYRSLERALEDAYADAASTADAAFPPARLDVQRRSILSRLGQREHRVLVFPERATRPLPRARLAVAAALILMTTTGLLRILTGQPPADFRRSDGASRPAIAPQASARQEAVYLDIETALVRHGTAELQALDDLTPRATGLVAPPR
jgi:hypothetical protein